MGFFDRFTSRKGKADKSAPKAKDTPAPKPATTKTSSPSEKSSAPQPIPAQTSSQSRATGRAYRVLVSPHVTEKSARIEQRGQYVFDVAPDATKKTVTEAIQKVYGVRPAGVNIVRLPGKWVRYGRTMGRQVARKKAIVRLPAGKSIDVMSA